MDLVRATSIACLSWAVVEPFVRPENDVLVFDLIVVCSEY